MATTQDKKEQERQTLYTELHKHCQNQDDEKASKVASKILHLFPNDEVAFHTKVVSFVSRGMFTEGLTLIQESPKFEGSLGYEKAYCLYRLQRMGEAKDVLEGIKDDKSLRRMELMYQIHYRLDNFEQAYDILSDLIKNTEDENDEERMVNLAAMVASLKMAKSTKRVKSVEGDSYEMLYNRAVELIGDDKIEEAERVLVKAEQRAKEFMKEEDTPEEDMADEMTLIASQRAYCLQRMGRVKEALALYQKVLKDKPDDVGIVAVVSNNILCGNKDTSVFDAKKRLRCMTQDDALARLNKVQKRDMLLNECLYDLCRGQFADAQKLCKEIEGKYPELVEELLLIRCAMKTQSESIGVARKEFMDAVPKGSDLWLKVCLGLIQIALENDNMEAAIDFFRQLEDHYYRPGVISAVVTLYHSRGMMDKAANVMKEAVNHFKKTGKKSDVMKLLLRYHASFMMSLGNYKEAVESFEDLRKLTSSSDEDTAILAKMIIAYSKVDVEKAKKLSKQLPAPSAEDIDPAGLESPNWLTAVKALKKGVKSDIAATPKSAATTDGETKKKTKTRKKKNSKPAKNFDPDRRVDPERWLPKYERTGYRPKKSRKQARADVGKGTQGADSASAAIYDMSGKVGRGLGEDSPSVSSASTSGWRKDQRKKSKKKK